MAAKRTESKPKSTTRKRVLKRAPAPVAVHDEIAVRAYFLHLQAPESDEVGNWLRAERELTPA